MSVSVAITAFDGFRSRLSPCRSHRRTIARDLEALPGDDAVNAQRDRLRAEGYRPVRRHIGQRRQMRAATEDGITTAPPSPILTRLLSGLPITRDPAGNHRLGRVVGDLDRPDACDLLTFPLRHQAIAEQQEHRAGPVPANADSVKSNMVNSRPSDPHAPGHDSWARCRPASSGHRSTSRKP